MTGHRLIDANVYRYFLMDGGPTTDGRVRALSYEHEVFLDDLGDLDSVSPGRFVLVAARASSLCDATRGRFFPTAEVKSRGVLVRPSDGRAIARSLSPDALPLVAIEDFRQMVRETVSADPAVARRGKPVLTEIDPTEPTEPVDEEDDEGTVIQFDILGFSRGTEAEPTNLVHTPSGCYVRNSEPNRWLNTAHGILQKVVRDVSYGQDHATALFFMSDGGHLVFKRPFGAYVAAAALMRKCVCERIPARIGIGHGTFSSIAVSCEFRSDPPYQEVTARYFGKAVINANAAYKYVAPCGPVRIHPSVVENDGTKEVLRTNEFVREHDGVALLLFNHQKLHTYYDTDVNGRRTSGPRSRTRSEVLCAHARRSQEGPVQKDRATLRGPCQSGRIHGL